MSASAENAAPAPFPVEASRLYEWGARFPRKELIVPDGTRVEDLLVPGFWRLCASRLLPLTIISCTDDRQSFYAELQVISSNSGQGAEVRVLYGVTLHGVGAQGASVRNPTGARVEYKGSHLRWCVLLGDQLLKDLLETEALANQWLQSYAHTTRKQP